MVKNDIPYARKKDKVLHHHGIDRMDSWYWLREREDPEVRHYLERENDYYNAVTADQESLKDRLYKELRGRVKEKDLSVPVFLHGYYYYEREIEGGEYPVYCRSKTIDGLEHVYLDVNSEAQDHDFYDVADLGICPGGGILGFTRDLEGRRKYELCFRDVESGRDVGRPIKNTSGNFAWAMDRNTLLYVRQHPETLRDYQVWRYRIKEGDNELIYQEDDETFSVSVFRSKSDRYLMICSSSTVSTEYRMIDARHPLGAPEVFTERRRGHEYYVYDSIDGFYILSNHEAKNFRIFFASHGETGEHFWREWLGHRPHVLVSDIEIFKDYLVVEEVEAGLTQLNVVHLGSKDSYRVPFSESLWCLETAGNVAFDTSHLRFIYESLTTPSSVYEFDMATKDRRLLKQQEIPSGYKASAYQDERLLLPARDGVLIPVSLVYRKDRFVKHQAPLLLYAYGSYGISSDPGFSTNRLSLLDRGFVYAIAHVRGGSEMGRSWYEDGRQRNKLNTFYDYIDVATELSRLGYSRKDGLYGLGGSAGGLLMGAVVNMAPSLFRGIVAEVPFVDVVTTMLDDSVPLTTSEYDEWGNPNDDGDFSYMLQYSPYDNVEPGPFPNLLVLTGFHDSQVQYWEPAKWVAKLRDVKRDHESLILFKTNFDVGHGGSTGRFAALKEVCEIYGFLLKLEGIYE